MLEDFFDHTCNIFHIVREDKSPGFALPASSSFSYPDGPDEAEIPCHFGVKSFNHSITQKEPNNDFEAKIKLTLPIGTDIRPNDKIVEPTTGYEFTAEIPRNIRGHHLFVYIQRVGAQKPL